MNFLIFILSYFLILISVVGYGLIFKSSFYENQKKINLGYTGILGLFILIIYSYSSSFFFAHSITHNTIVLIVGIFFFIIRTKKNLTNNKFEHIVFFLLFLILFISSLVYKTNEDFPYYHFNYTMLLTERSSLIGIGSFNHGFRTPSSIFYINSLFYLPFIKFYSFHMAAILIMGFSNYILLQKLQSAIKKNKFNFITYLSLLSFIFINIVFYRIAEHGTDRSAQILVLIFVIELLFLINFFNKDQYKKSLKKILILVGIIASLKAFYILYLIFIGYLLFFLNKKIYFFKIIRDNFLFFLLLSLSIILVLIINLQNSGCFLYPVNFTCILSLPWTFSQEELTLMSIHYENWAKGGAGPGFKVDMDPKIYISNFNWVGNWIKIYFLEKGLNTIFGIITISLVIFFIFFSKNKLANKKRNYKIIYFIIFFLLIEWFWKHPSFRYGGFCLFALLIFLPTSLLIEKYYHEKYKLKLISLVSITLIVFYARNIHRIVKEVEKYNYQPIIQAFYYVNLSGNDNFFSSNKDINHLILKFNKCELLAYPHSDECNNVNKKIGKIYGKYFFKSR
jgi:hypothetical protein